MDDVLRYAGKRVIVAGAAAGVGEATTRLLIELGAEVHAVDARKPDVGGLASFTETDLRDTAQIDTAVARIGSIVNALFNCAHLPGAAHVAAVRELTERVVPLMLDGAAVGSVAFGQHVIVEYTASRALPFAEQGVRINCVNAELDTPAEGAAWPLLFLNSSRASFITGATVPVDPSGPMSQG